MGIKITEMTEATQVNNNDLFMIVQNGENKKITKETLQDSIVDAELEERVDTLEDNVEDLQDEVEALQEENLYLNSLVEQAFDKKEVEGEELSIDDTVNAKMEVGLEGNITQKTTTGKQLFDYEDLKDKIQTLTTTGNGKNFTISGSGSYQYLISLTGQKKITGNWNTANLNGHLKVVYEDDTTANILSSYSSASASGTINLTTDSSKNIKAILIQIYTNSTITIENFMISTSGGEYEPYTNGASPNPDYPQEVNVVTGDNEVVVSNKNILDTSSMVLGDLSNETGEEVSVANQTHYRSGYIKVLPNTQYTFITNYTYTSSGITKLMEYADDKSFIGRNSQSSTNKIITFTTSSTTKYLRICMYSSNAFTNFYSLENMLEEGSTATSYIQHQEQTFQINLGNIELCKIGDYRDYLYKSNNKWYKHSEIGKVVLDGSENWYKTSDTSASVFVLANVITTKSYGSSGIALSSHFKYQFANTAGKFYFGTATNIALCMDTTYDLAGFKTWIGTNNVTLYYILNTPTETEITDTTLISQLEALKTAMSYAGQTNISQINNDTPFILQVTALASYNSRIVALENAILNANRSTPVENTRKINEVIGEPKEEVVNDNKDEPKEEIKEER